MESIPCIWPDDVRRQVDEAFRCGRVTAVRAALKAITDLPDSLRGPEFRLGIVRTFTLETQLDTFRLSLATMPCQPQIFLGPLDNIEQVLLDQNSELLSEKPDAIVAIWRLEELHPRLAFESARMSPEARLEAADSLIARIENLCRSYESTSTSHAPLFISTFATPDGTQRIPDHHEINGLEFLVHRINSALLAFVAGSRRTNLFDLAGWVGRYGAAAFDPRMDFFARQPLAAGALASFCLELSAALRPLLYAPRKVLALDLDNVLWGGVIGEDGLSGIRIGHDFPGNIYRRIQQFALSIRSRGVLLVLLSKNNLADVEAAFAALPHMPIRLDDFAAIRVNWREKHENLRDIAAELNLGLDSFVFVDDQPFEREQMAFNLPQVSVLNITEDPLRILEALLHTRHFDAYRTSAEDRNRSDEYAMQRLRRGLEQSTADAGEFLRSLSLVATVDRVRESSIGRAVQMLAKTNQFNASTRRHTEADLRALIASGGILLTVAVHDRFGDQGIAGLLIACPEPENKVFVDTFLLSCRVIGRGVEDVLWSTFLRHANETGYQAINAEYIASAKNGQVSDLFGKFGMFCTGKDAEGKRYLLPLPTSYALPAWITVHDISENE